MTGFRRLFGFGCPTGGLTALVAFCDNAFCAGWGFRVLRDAPDEAPSKDFFSPARIIPSSPAMKANAHERTINK
jgi:hypothetical protein